MLGPRFQLMFLGIFMCSYCFPVFPCGVQMSSCVCVIYAMAMYCFLMQNKSRDRSVREESGNVFGQIRKRIDCSAVVLDLSPCIPDVAKLGLMLLGPRPDCFPN